MGKKAELALHCAACGMLIDATEFHPYLACMAFRGSNDADGVRANLRYVIDYGRSEEKKAKEARHAR